MRACEPVGVEGDVVVLGFTHDFHRSKVEEERNKRDVEDVLSNLTGQRYRVRCILGRQASATVPSPRPASDGLEQSASTGGEAASSVEQIIAEDPVVRAAVEDLGAQVVQ